MASHIQEVLGIAPAGCCSSRVCKHKPSDAFPHLGGLFAMLPCTSAGVAVVAWLRLAA